LAYPGSENSGKNKGKGKKQITPLRGRMTTKKQRQKQTAKAKKIMPEPTWAPASKRNKTD
jgi:hypothetical protein